jgi:putative ABC transport system ATP-binding protein
MGVEPAHVAVRAEAVTKIYGEAGTRVVALDEVTAGFGRGAFTAIMGPSGSGKSTLMHCLAGLDSVTSGQVFLGDTEVTALDDKRLTALRRDRIGFVFQSFNLVPTLTALENITLPLDLAGRAPDKEWLDRVIDTVGLADRLHHRPSELSGGQQQRVACARAMAAQPDVIFADEPTGNLDSRASGEILDFLRRSVDETHQTIIIVTHDPVSAAYADRALFLADGQIVDDLAEPTAEAVLARMKRFDAPAQRHG